SSLVMVLQDIQSEFNYLPCEALEMVAAALSVPRSRVFSVATFSKVFRLKPQGKTIIQVCKGTACHVRGAQLLEDELARRLEVEVGGTTKDLAFTLRTVNCVGACAMAPVVIVGERYHGEVKPAEIERMLKNAGRSAGSVLAAEIPAATTAAAETAADRAVPPPVAEGQALLGTSMKSPREVIDRSAIAAETRRSLRGSIVVCGGPGCLAAGAKEVHAALHHEAATAGINLRVELGECRHSPDEHRLTLSGCQGLCQKGPLVHVLPQDTLYTQVKASDARAIVDAVASKTVVERLLAAPGSPTRAANPFYQGQELRALATCGKVDPTSLDDYLALGGFAALARAVAELSPAQVLEMVASSGLRGRGGAGFATGRKWQSALRAAGKSGLPPFVLCNGDEGDPGAFMDRAIMEGSPFQVIEGMILGAYALGASEGYVYVRAEYPLAVTRLQHAIEVCRHAGLLGTHILGGKLSFDINISRGGGAFVCGESTALMRSLEGKVGEPRAKYVRSVERGLYDRPTVLNNVETWALVPGIVRNGPQWLSSLGTAGSKGTKAFSLVGQVKNTGLVEVPMGTTLRHLIFDIGGGVRDGRAFKAVQTGGPSGGCLPESKLDLPIDFEALSEAGSMMGSGGMIVMDDRTCMVDVARYFVEFLKEESCGKCVPCRLGLQQLSHLLGRLVRGQAVAADLDAILDIAQGMTENSLCGLGKSAPNPVLSTLRYFRDEYEAHLRGVCPAGVCRELISYEITPECPGCLRCIRACPVTAIAGKKQEVHVIDQTLCTRCGICRSICQFDAVRVVLDAPARVARGGGEAHRALPDEGGAPLGSPQRGDGEGSQPSSDRRESPPLIGGAR
ncbi:MAG: NAD(P)H-dependent oxidoreductase subunit E, partial [Pseudomonadota bacterium]